MIKQYRETQSFKSVFKSTPLARITAICQPSMVAGNAIGQQAPQLAISLNRKHRATSSVIDTNQVAIDKALKLFGVLAKVMQQAGNLCQLLSTKRGGTLSGQMTDRSQVLR